MALLEVRNVKKVYTAKLGAVKVQALSDVNFSVEEGEYVAIMGESGSGKTTLLNCISCYIPFDKGNIKLGGVELAGMNEEELARVRNTKIGFVFQDFMLLDGLTIRENILVPRIVQGEVPGEAEKLADQLAAMFGIGHILNKYPAEISGGEKQRAAVARSLINNPLIILADEPTGNLDSNTSVEVMNLMKKVVREKNQTLVMVTHDNYLAGFADVILRIRDGKIIEIEDHRGEEIPDEIAVKA